MNTPEIIEKLKTGITPSLFSTCGELSDVELFVPLYQRLFVWEVDQISQILENLKQAHCNNEPCYYIGTLTVHQTFKDSASFDVPLNDALSSGESLHPMQKASIVRVSKRCWPSTM